MSEQPNKKLEMAQAQFDGFEESFKSVNLATVSSEGLPHASYAPFVYNENKEIFFFLSGMTQHCKNLTDTHKLSVLFVEDESKTEQVFARKRLSYDAQSTLLERESPEWLNIVALFSDKFGELIQQLRSMPDFRIFKCQLLKGRFVFGFGSAYNIEAENLNKLVAIRHTGHGHHHAHGK